MNKKGMSYFSMVIVLLCLTIGVAVTTNANFDADSFKSNLNWTHVSFPVNEAPDLSNALESFANGLGEAIFSIGKFFAQWSSEHPEVPFKLLFWLFLFSIAAPILIFLFKFIVIIVLLTRESISKRKENKEIKRLKLMKYMDKYNE